MSTRGPAAPAGAAPLDVLVVGDLNPDLLVHGAELTPRWGQAEQDAAMRLVLGGSAAICAAGMARLGLRVALCAVVAGDELGDVAVRMVADRGVGVERVRVVPDAASALSVHLLSGGARAIYTARGAMVGLTAEEAAAAVAALRPRHVHLASVFLLPSIVRDGAGLLETARSTGATVSVDTNFDPSDTFARPSWLLDADVLMPNETEALRLTGRAVDAIEAVEASARELAAGGALVAVKQGARGAFARRGPERVEIALQPASVEVADAVGAGDSFDAGLVRGMLDGLALRESLALACAAGTLSTRAAGGTAAQPALDEARAYAAKLLA